MGTLTASGASTARSTAVAGREAARQAMAGLGDRKAGFGFLFCSPEHDLATALRTVRLETHGTDVIGSTTAGEITERGRTQRGLALLLVAPENTAHRIAFAKGMAQPEQAAATLGDGFKQTQQAAMRARQVHSTTVLLTDGLAGTGEALVEAVRAKTDVFQQIVGGAAGDAGKFEATLVGAGDEASTGAAAALHCFGARPWGVGVGHGLEPNSESLRVTRATANTLYELDGRPAFEAYRAHARARGIDLQPGSAGPYLIGNELGIFRFGEFIRARAPLSVGADGSLTCAAEVPEGAAVCILDGEPEKMVAAAKQAAEEARANLEGAAAAGVLLFDCVCRGMILDRRFDEEVHAVRDVFGEVPVAGFCTYGEIAQYRAARDGWHNATAVVVAIPA